MSATKRIVHSHSVPELLIAQTGQEAFAGVPLDVPAAVANKLLEQKHWHEYDGPDPDDLESQTVDGLKAIAKDRGIEHPANIKKSDLIVLIEQHATQEAVAESEES